MTGSFRRIPLLVAFTALIRYPSQVMAQTARPMPALRSQQKRTFAATLATHAMLGFWVLVSIFPLFWVAVTSLKGEHEIFDGPYYLPFIDFTPSLDAWVTILTYDNDRLILRFLNSCIIGLSATSLTLLLGGMATYGLTRFRVARHWRGLRVDNGGILFAILATRILPPVVVALPVFVMAQYAGMLDTRTILIFAYTASNLPVAVWLMMPVFGQHATHQEEAAQLDGATHLQIFFTIFLPMVALSVAAVGLLVFVLCWNEYLFSAYLASDHAVTLPSWVIGQMSIKEAQTGGDGQEWPQLSAAIVFMITPVIACATLAQRFLGRMALWNRSG